MHEAAAQAENDCSLLTPPLLAAWHFLHVSSIVYSDMLRIVDRAL